MTGTNHDWTLLKAIVVASNKGDKDEMYRLISANDFSDKPQASHGAITTIELVKNEIALNQEALLKFVDNINDNNFDIRAKFRLSVLRDMLGLED